MTLCKTLATIVLLAAGSISLAQAGDLGDLQDPNLIESDALRAVPHIDDALAEAIEAGRPYLNASQLDAVLAESLKREQREEVYAHIFRQIDLNHASEDEILVIPGMSGKMAHEFEEYRPYASLEQFNREIGKYVDEDEVARLRQHVFIPLNLNTASEEAIMTIPGMSGKMAHEFEEYRPYSSLEQFRREIGKYVDEAEVARLESYVTLE